MRFLIVCVCTALNLEVIGEMQNAASLWAARKPRGVHVDWECRNQSRKFAWCNKVKWISEFQVDISFAHEEENQTTTHKQSCVFHDGCDNNPVALQCLGMLVFNPRVFHRESDYQLFAVNKNSSSSTHVCTTKARWKFSCIWMRSSWLLPVNVKVLYKSPLSDTYLRSRV